MSEKDIQAGELALRLLDGEELLAARRLLVEDPDFAAAVAQWESRFAPWYDEFPERALPADLWSRIEARLARGGDALVISLKRQLRAWRAAAAIGGGAAIAAALALLLVPTTVTPPPVAPPVESPVRGPLLVASVDAGTTAVVGLTYLSDSGELLIVPARLAVPDRRARQLWLIPAGQAPVSLGLVEGEAPQRRVLATAVRQQIALGATVAISDEPTGGSPTGLPTGEVLGTGTLQQG
ncbi:anti-sigma-K factor RskA [Sphingomonas kaistensis]|uniref:Anti-sigma-K factor RskA n=1 Tax=Sphingomonas kaistensis TaxID=298708 RepID=A0A7X5Y6I9_9SPHN|nr:anti-sigma factor [Sphingomonas kaistensis]NJC06042.1 anti-sigma-K factor RskA [Sphingomonas kaistensis]